MDREASTVLDLVRRITLAAAAPAVLLAATVTSAPAFAEVGVPAPTTEQLLMADVVALTNEQRARYGLTELAVENELTIVSVRQSHFMAVKEDLTHFGWNGSTFQTRSRDEGYHDPAGENIAWGYLSATEVVDAWMASPAHRRNILNSEAVSFGAGVQRAPDGTLYWTQVFGYR
ncbi:CAP domain-containing protein [Actinoplanes sp. NPDC051494]|uniref:CAP domain-containing protein n=1 Tax=Actinoplanes sp. NPDC051494 TaxID=3363907 RepID=UPI0037BA5602